MTTHLHFSPYTNTGKTPLVLAHSLGLGPELFDPLVPLITDRFDIVFATLPGHSGQTTAKTAFTIHGLATEVTELGTSSGWTHYGFLGVSIGGAIGMELSRMDSRVSGVICVSAGATFGSKQMWQERADQARAHGTSAFVEPSRARWFAPGFVEAHTEAANGLLKLLADCDGPSYAEACDAISRFDFSLHQGSVGQPILILNGSEDLLVTPTVGEAAAALVSDAQAHTVEGVAHLGPFEKPEVYAEALGSFLKPRLSV